MASPDKEVVLITDGAAVGNPGPGGWAYILRYGSHRSENAGSVPETTTNNRMEMTAAIEGLRALTEPCRVRLVTDSMYVVKGINSWRHGWRRAGWVKGREKSPVPNADLWQALDTLAGTHQIEVEWVRGHNGHPDNERCDQLATACALGKPIPLRPRV